MVAWTDPEALEGFDRYGSVRNTGIPDCWQSRISLWPVYFFSSSLRHLPCLVSCIMDVDMDEPVVPSSNPSYGEHPSNGAHDYAMDTKPDQNSVYVQGTHPSTIPPLSSEPAPQPSSASLKPSSRSRLPKFKPRYVMSGHTMSISSIKFSPDGNVLASAGMYPFLSIVFFLSREMAAASGGWS